MSVPGNTFEAPPRTPRVLDLPPPGAPPPPGLLTPDLPPQFVPVLPGPAIVGKPASVMRMPGAVTPGLAAPPEPRTHADRTALPLASTTLFGTPVADTVTRVHERRPGERFKKLVGLLLVLGLTAGGVFAWTKYRPSAVGHPATWDPRVVPLVQFVEGNRELQFEHPVAVEFLEPAAYQERLRSDWLDVSDDERHQAEYEQELLDVFGLTATYNLLADKGAIESLASLGFYSPDSDSIVVRGQGMTPGVTTTLVHELTHALQAQHFRIGDSLGDLSTRSIAEADAMEVEKAYLDTLPPEQQWTAVAETKLTPEDEQRLARLPDTLVELEYAPYRLGRLAMDRRGTAGNSGINEALSSPPSEKQMIAPWAPTAGPVDGLTATAPADSTVVEENQQLSLLELLVMLDAWLPWSMARPSLDAWIDGVFTTYRVADGPLCAAVHIVLSAPATSLADAIGWWTALMGAPATPQVAGNDVTFTLCARGKGAPEPPDAVVPTTVAVEVELSVVPADLLPVPGAAPQIIVLRPDQAPPSASLGAYLCMARTIVDDPAAAPLIALPWPTAEQQAVLDQRIEAAITTCHG